MSNLRAASAAYDAAFASLIGCKGLLTEPLTEAKLAMLRQRMNAVADSLAPIFVLMGGAEAEAPFIPASAGPEARVEQGPTAVTAENAEPSAHLRETPPFSFFPSRRRRPRRPSRQALEASQAMSCLNLVLNAHAARGAGGPGPASPTLIPTGYARPLHFKDIDALARHIHRRRGRRGLRLTRVVAQYGGSDTFPAFEVRWLSDTGDEEYAFTLAVQGRPRESLEAALAANNPDQPGT